MSTVSFPLPPHLSPLPLTHTPPLRCFRLLPLCFLQMYQEACGSEMAVLPISAKQSAGRDELLQWMLANIPNGPAYYPKVL